MRRREDPTGAVRIVRVTGIAGDLGEPPLKINPMTPSGTGILSVGHDVLPMNLLVGPIAWMGKQRMTGLAGRRCLGLTGTCLVAIQARGKTILTKTETVQGGIAPSFRMGKKGG